MFLASNPKAYNIDKLLAFISREKSVYLLFFVGIDADKKISTFLCPVFDKQLIHSTVIIKHWAGRNSRGVAQFFGNNIRQIINSKISNIDNATSDKFIAKLLQL